MGSKVCAAMFENFYRDQEQKPPADKFCCCTNEHTDRWKNEVGKSRKAAALKVTDGQMKNEVGKSRNAALKLTDGQMDK
jgi:hypothetical protein